MILISADSQKFFTALYLVYSTIVQLLYRPVELLPLTGVPLWMYLMEIHIACNNLILLGLLHRWQMHIKSQAWF